MKKSKTKSSVSFLLVVVVVFGLLCAGRAYAQVIPALEDIPPNLPAAQQDRFRARQAHLDTELAAFQSDSNAFNELSAEQQSDEEYGRLLTRRKEYVAQVKQYNADLATAFKELRDTTIHASQQGYSSQIQRLMNDIKNIKVPSPEQPRKIHEGIILGLNDPADQVEQKYEGVTSPWSGKEIGTENIYATTDSDDFKQEFIRGLKDNATVSEFTLNNPYGKDLVAKLQGASFDRLLAHSNGSTIAEALIRSGVIHVEELNVIGGDRSLTNLDGLQELINSGKVKRVVVWNHPGDPIPTGGAAPQIALLTNPVRNPKLTAVSVYFAGLLKREKGSGRVEVRTLQGSQYSQESQEFHLDKRIFAAHDLKNEYLANIATYFGPPAKKIRTKSQ